jgi:hypothetical protein
MDARPSPIDEGHGEQCSIKAPSARTKGEFMSRQNGRVLVEKIEDAIEQAADPGLAFVAGILMMARVEAMQTDLMTYAGSADEKRR